MGFDVADIAALYEANTEEGLSLAADLAAAISAVDLTDVLTDDTPFETAKVRTKHASGLAPVVAYSNERQHLLCRPRKQ